MLSMVGSVPFWALLVLHYGNVWGNFFLLTGAPKFMNEVSISEWFFFTKIAILKPFNLRADSWF